MAKKATGGRQGRQHTSAPPKTHTKDLGNPPESMGEFGKEMWKHIQENLPWVGSPDFFLVKEICEIYEMKETIRLKFDKNLQQTTITVKNQGKRLHPEIQLLKELQTQISAMMREIGMTPQSRKDLDVRQEAEESKLQAYARRTRQRAQKDGE